MRKYMLCLMVVAAVTLGAHRMTLHCVTTVLTVFMDEFVYMDMFRIVLGVVAVTIFLVVYWCIPTAMVARELHLKFRWVFLANLVTVTLVVVGLATNPELACLFLLGLIFRQIGDLPKADLESAEGRAKRRPVKTAA